MGLNADIMANFSEEIGQKVTDFIVTDGRESSSGTRESMLCRETSTTGTLGWQAGRCPVVSEAKHIMEHTLVKCKTMISNGQGGNPAGGTLFTGQFSRPL